MIYCNSYNEAKLQAIYLISYFDNFIENIHIFWDDKKETWVVDYTENDDYRECE